MKKLFPRMGNKFHHLLILADAAITDSMVQLQRTEEGEKKGTSRTGKVDGRREKEGDEVQRL